MSGPIVRKYGFPNFEKIVGQRAPQHGIDDAETSERTPDAKTPSEPSATPAPEASPEATPAESKATR